MSDDLNLVERLGVMEQELARQRLRNTSPDDGKYARKSDPLRDFFSAEAEWNACADVQGVLLETRIEFGKADESLLETFREAREKYDPLNASLIEGELQHDQLAVIAELGRHGGPELQNALHPGTTSYDILDTARSWLYKGAWDSVVRPKATEVVSRLCEVSERYEHDLQAGRTHLQKTSPVLFRGVLAGYAARIADRIERLDLFADDLRGKVSGIVGTGASVEMVIGEGKALDFEEAVLAKLGLKPDYTATQIVQKEKLADVGHGITTLMRVIGDFANDMRYLYSSDVGEITNSANAERLGGSSADASKNNPINWENISGKVAEVESGMRVMYELIMTDQQRDLRGSVQHRYQPGPMTVQTYESLSRMAKNLEKLTVIEDRMAANLQSVRDFPSEAMVSILRGQQYLHPEYGVGHETVKEFSKIAKSKGERLLDVSLRDNHFANFFAELPELQQSILMGEVERYTGAAATKADRNREYALSVVEQ